MDEKARLTSDAEIRERLMHGHYAYHPSSLADSPRNANTDIRFLLDSIDALRAERDEARAQREQATLAIAEARSAIATARAEGRAEGMEEAAAQMDSDARRATSGGTYNVLTEAGRRIRALAASEATR